MFKKALEFIPLFTLLFLFIGFLEQYSYFIIFNIPIYHFLDSSEIALFFLPTIIKFQYLILYFCMGFIMSIVVSDTKKKPDQKLPKETIALRKILFPLMLFIITTALLSLIPFYKYTHGDREEYLSNLFYVQFSPFLSFLFLLVYFLEYYKELTNISLLLVFVLGLVFYGNYRRDSAKFIMNHGNYQNVSFRTNGKIFTSNDSMIFIGETKNYLFIYNKKFRSSLVYERNKIDSLSYFLIK